MRKIFWFGCALSVTAAAFVFVTARHVQRCPGSTIANCCRGAVQAASLWNPLFSVGQRAGMQTAALMEQVLAQPKTAGAAPKDAGCCAPHSAAPRCVREPEPIPEVIDLTSFRRIEVEPMPLQNEPVQPIAVEVSSGTEDEVETVPAGAIEENEPIPPMPPADDDDVQASVPSVQSSIEFWLDLIQDVDAAGEYKNAEPLPMPKAVEDGTTEENEPMAETAPVPETTPPDLQEDPHMNQRYPGCPASGSCPATHSCPPSGCPAGGGMKRD